MNPPGHTCPGIDGCIRAARRMVRSAHALAEADPTLAPYADRLAADTAMFVSWANRVREENVRMRAALAAHGIG